MVAACVNPKYRDVVVIFGSQMSKTDGVLLNVAGQKLDDDPAPILYIGPTKSNIDSVIEPRVEQMLSSSASLSRKTIRGRRAKKLVKRVAGVTFRLAWAGSPTELAAQPAHTVLVDEVDRMKAISGEGDPVTLAKARNATYPDGRVIITSTPTEGSVETAKHPDTGIEHWQVGDPEDIASTAWRYWQEGTRFELAVPCPHCADFFVPRFRLLTWPEKCTPTRALREARLVCPNCGGLIGEEHKARMNELGQFLAPGQKVVDGGVVGEIPECEIASFWGSGLLSPWVTFGGRAAAWLRAVASGDQERIRSVLNTAFGELYRTRGQAPEWQAVKACAIDTYKQGDVPAQVQLLFLTVDVQKDRLVVLVRGWGVDFESWLIQRDELWGATDEPAVWSQLDALVEVKYADQAIKAVAVDSGYRTDIVYDWCHGHGTRAYAMKGRDNPTKLYTSSPVEVNRAGRRLRTGLKVWTFDHAYFKGWVHERTALPQDAPGSWHLPSDIDEIYCKQIVAEQRMRLPSGRSQWVRVSKDNHYLDCEALQVFLAHVEGVRLLQPVSDAIVVPTAPRLATATWMGPTRGNWFKR